MSIYQNRREQLIQNVKEKEQNQGSSGILITHPKNVFYLTGFHTDPHERFMGLVWSFKGGWSLILPQLDQEAAEQIIDSSINTIGFGDHQPAQITLPS